MSKKLNEKNKNIIDFFSSYLKINNLVHLEDEDSRNSRLKGKRLGILNGSSWISIWSNYFAKKYLPGVNTISIGNDAIQFNFMKAYYDRKKCPPEENIKIFIRNARELEKLARVDAILITCSTMNRSYLKIKNAITIPVVQIDLPMMEKAVHCDGKVLIIATHRPTVESSKILLNETALRMKKNISYTGVLLEKAWEFLSKGDIIKHNEIIASAIHKKVKKEKLGCVVLAQLSMSLFTFSYPDALKEFGVPIYDSGQLGFKYMVKVLENINK
ncbi:MAG: hypothetical protein A2163_03165 [Actinobacteria bacterium RBG_13_35_12]|nr:MAG: hypothetical protein A2163_03165 [Actinobacteria bacterium RBG_13_35_12]